MFPVNVVGIDGELQYGELERTAQSLDKGTAYRVMLGTDTTITEVDGSRILSTWQIVWQCHYISTLCFGAHLLSVGDLLNLYHGMGLLTIPTTLTALAALATLATFAAGLSDEQKQIKRNAKKAAAKRAWRVQQGVERREAEENEAADVDVDDWFSPSPSMQVTVIIHKCCGAI